ncbi:flavin reductase family protein [Methylovulum psychrotolerans]|uniref:Flavin reductase n=1 Tax=Methylovulum psychrotolerans TaxID=1704499 RepID=A0A2S5CJT1_9GAMM|nr:flavin reductase family protein [Methylovulum psychrotolerans]POZ51048.1 flavin reductase [Methylovulum psychrotolerans]
MTVSVDDFKKALQLWGSGVSVVTTCSEKFGNQGMTVTAFTSVSVSPPQILVCLNALADTGEGIGESGRFAVNILTDAQQEMSNQFAGGSSQAQRFANTPWQLGGSGVPVLTESLMSLECTVVEKVRAGTHWIVVGEVQYSHCREGAPLLYYCGAYRQLADS